MVFPVKLTSKEVKIRAKDTYEKMFLTTTFKGKAPRMLKCCRSTGSNYCKSTTQTISGIKCHLLSEFTTETMETWEEPTNSMKRVDQVTNDLRQVGTTVDKENKHVVAS